jgi:2-polyprenyl-6-methoxyphenol hydroxylase-like FAD-dependent oxidoreductase
MTSTHSNHEVVVVGARCAGAATAMLLARQGHDVVMVDRTTMPSDTLSTHAISRGGVVQLSRWGLLDDLLASGAPPIRQVSFHLGGEADVRTVKSSAGVDHLLAPRRYVLDSILAEAAQDAGASFLSGHTVLDTIVEPGTGRVTGVVVRDEHGTVRQVTADVVVGADGLHSRIARSVGARVVDARPSDAATWYAYVDGLDAEGFEFHLGDRSFAGLFLTNGREANVWVCSPADHARLEGHDRTAAFLDLLRRTAPSLADRVDRAVITSPVRGAVRFPNQVREAAGPGWALVGDAAYHRDPITGHGITDAFRDAELLAGHLAGALRGEVPEAVALTAYEQERRAALAPIFELTCRLAQYPPLEEFTELQKQLSTLIEIEAQWLADLPILTAGDLVAA